MPVPWKKTFEKATVFSYFVDFSPCRQKFSYQKQFCPILPAEVFIENSFTPSRRLEFFSKNGKPFKNCRPAFSKAGRQIKLLQSKKLSGEKRVTALFTALFVQITASEKYR